VLALLHGIVRQAHDEELLALRYLDFHVDGLGVYAEYGRCGKTGNHLCCVFKMINDRVGKVKDRNYS
jgi:hypothetical protein